jgi:hypothetical protein
MTSPLPAKKSTKLGAGEFMRLEQLEGGLSKGDFGEREEADSMGQAISCGGACQPWGASGSKGKWKQRNKRNFAKIKAPLRPTRPPAV